MKQYDTTYTQLLQNNTVIIYSLVESGVLLGMSFLPEVTNGKIQFNAV